MSLDRGKDLMGKFPVGYRHVDFAAITGTRSIQIARSNNHQFLIHDHKLDVTLIIIHYKRLTFITLKPLDVETRPWSSASPPM